MAPILRAFLGYFFLVGVVRLVGRRPGRQVAPFELVFVFFIGGLALTAIVGKDGSFTNALTQIMTLAVAHWLVALVKSRSPRIARLLDGTPLLLLTRRHWHGLTLRKTHMQPNDIADAARQGGLQTLAEVDAAVLERNGEISILEAK